MYCSERQGCAVVTAETVGQAEFEFTYSIVPLVSNSLEDKTLTIAQ